MNAIETLDLNCVPIHKTICEDVDKEKALWYNNAGLPRNTTFPCHPVAYINTPLRSQNV